MEDYSLFSGAIRAIFFVSDAQLFRLLLFADPASAQRHFVPQCVRDDAE